MHLLGINIPPDTRVRPLIAVGSVDASGSVGPVFHTLFRLFRGCFGGSGFISDAAATFDSRTRPHGKLPDKRCGRVEALSCSSSSASKLRWKPP